MRDDDDLEDDIEDDEDDVLQDGQSLRVPLHMMDADTQRAIHDAAAHRFR